MGSVVTTVIAALNDQCRSNWRYSIGGENACQREFSHGRRIIQTSCKIIYRDWCAIGSLHGTYGFSIRTVSFEVILKPTMRDRGLTRAFDSHDYSRTTYCDLNQY